VPPKKEKKPKTVSVLPSRVFSQTRYAYCMHLNCRQVQIDGEVSDEDFQLVGKGGKALAVSAEGVFKTLQTLLEQRGRKNTDRAEQNRTLEKLLAVADTPYARIRVVLALASCLFDYNATVQNYLPAESWNQAREKVDELLDLLRNDRRFIIVEQTADYDELVDRTPEGSNTETVEIRGSILSLIDRLDDEFTKSLKELDPQAQEYIDRLRDERPLYATIVRAQDYFERVGLSESLDRVLLRRLEHVYCKVSRRLFPYYYIVF
jgi:translation initiation factor 3 subunit C